MRILLVTHRFPPSLGGVESHVEALSREFAKLGHQVEVHSADRGRHADPTLPDDVRLVRHQGWAPGNAYFVSPSLGTAVRRIRDRFDVIHAHNYHALPAYHAFRARGNTPFIFTTHYHRGGHTALRNALHAVYRPLAGRMVLGADCLIAVSRPEADLLRQDFPGAPVAAVIPNGVDVDAFAGNPPAEIGKDWIVAGRIERYKQIRKVVDAIASADDLTLTILGDGPDAESLSCYVARSAAADRVNMVGAVSRREFVRRVREARGLVTMSEKEAFGITVVEAVAAGLPVVASEIPAHAALWTDFPQHIQLVPLSADAGDITKALRSAPRPLPTDVVHRYDWRAIARKTLEVYEEAAR